MLVLDQRLLFRDSTTYHVLGERLAEGNVVALLDKVADGKGVLVNVATGEALVGHVEEGKVAMLLGDLGNLLPLLLRGVDTGGVVSTGVEEEDTALGGGLDVGDHAVKVQANGMLVVVAVLLDLEAGVGEDGLVVGPRRGGDVNLLLAGVEAGEEVGANAQSTGAGDGLGDGQAVEGGRVLAVSELGGQGRKLGNTGDAGVLLVQLLVNDLLLGLADGGQDIRLALVITVSADTCDGTLACDCYSWVVCGVFRDEANEPRLIFLSKLSALKASVMPVRHLY